MNFTHLRSEGHNAFSYHGPEVCLVQLYVTCILFQDIIEVDAETKEMLKMMDFQSIPGLQMTTAGNSNPNYCHFLLSPHLSYQVAVVATPTTRETATREEALLESNSGFLMIVISSALTCAELSRSRLTSDLISERSRWLREERISPRTP